MKITCGTDIIEIDRIKKSVDDENKKFVNEIYSENEIEYCESKKNVKYQHYAARFAAKEAIFKAISNNLENKFELTWKDVEVINNKEGRPIVRFLNKVPKNLENIDISISHCKEFAVAMVTATWRG